MTLLIRLLCFHLTSCTLTFCMRRTCQGSLLLSENGCKPHRTLQSENTSDGSIQFQATLSNKCMSIVLYVPVPNPHLESEKLCFTFLRVKLNYWEIICTSDLSEVVFEHFFAFCHQAHSVYFISSFRSSWVFHALVLQWVFSIRSPGLFY